MAQMRRACALSVSAKVRCACRQRRRHARRDAHAAERHAHASGFALRFTLLKMRHAMFTRRCDYSMEHRLISLPRHAHIPFSVPASLDARQRFAMPQHAIAILRSLCYVDVALCPHFSPDI